MKLTAFILAAGKGTRMKSAQPKVLHKLLGHPLAWWPIEAARKAGAERIVVVISEASQDLRRAFADQDDLIFVEQKERLGTGHAVKTALDACPQEALGDKILLLYGDTPLVRAETLSTLVHKLDDANSQLGCAVLTMKPDNPSGYGRIALEASNSDSPHIAAIIEDKDCSDAQREQLRECNSGIYVFDREALSSHINKIGRTNAQGEYYITDIVALLRESELYSAAICASNYTELLGVNSRSELARATKIMQLRINKQLMDQGVSMLDPNLVWVDPEVHVGEDTELLPLTFLSGNTRIGKGCRIGPNSRLHSTQVGNDCVVEETVADSVIIDDAASAGPRAYLRPGTHLCPGSKAGTHVEIKNSTIGKNSKVPHLSYIGDTQMGENVNIGAGSITCNYDGYNKSATHIGNDVFVGSDTMMVAPVSIGDAAVIGAASCITQDVPARALGIERSPQKNLPDFRDRFEQKGLEKKAQASAQKEQDAAQKTREERANA